MTGVWKPDFEHEYNGEIVTCDLEETPHVLWKTCQNPVPFQAAKSGGAVLAVIGVALLSIMFLASLGLR